MKYSYTIVNEKGNVIKKGLLTEEQYNKATKHENVILKDSWETKYEEYTLYGKRYKIKNNNCGLFLWKEV